MEECFFRVFGCLVRNHQVFPLFICIFLRLLFAAPGFFDNKRDLSLVIFIKFAIYLARVEESGRLCVLVVLY